MTESKSTPYGEVVIKDGDAFFQFIHQLLEKEAAANGEATVGLTGGSTPKAFYAWAAERPDAFSEAVRMQLVWSVSDERMVSFEHPESNFGNADRQFLRALRIGDDRKMPFPVSLDPHSAAVAFSRQWEDRFGPGKVFDLCFLGMGDDGHTASMFPGGPVPGMDPDDPFTSVEVPDKGWRLTITPKGLGRCRRIVVLVTGAKKAARLKEVFKGPEDQYPIQLLKAHADRVTWLVDPAAAARIG